MKHNNNLQDFIGFLEDELFNPQIEDFELIAFEAYVMDDFLFIRIKKDDWDYKFSIDLTIEISLLENETYDDILEVLKYYGKINLCEMMDLLVEKTIEYMEEIKN